MSFWIRKNGGAWNNNGAADPTINQGGISLGNIGGEPVFVIAQGSGGGSLVFNFGQQPFTYTVPNAFTAGCPASGGGFTTFNPATRRAATGTSLPALTSGNQTVWWQLNSGLVQSTDSYTSGKYYFEFTVNSLSFFSSYIGGGVGKFYTDSSGVPADEGVPSFWFSEGRYRSDNLDGGANFISGNIEQTLPTVRLRAGNINAFGTSVVSSFATVAVGDVFSVAFSPDTGPQKPPPPVPPESYFTFLTCCNRAIMAHLYTFISAAGVSDYFTDFDTDIIYGGVTFKSQSLRFEGPRRKVSVGLSVDEQTLKVWAAPTDTLFGANFLSGAEEGLLDGATIIRQRILWEFATGNVALDVQNAPLTVFTLFTGFTSQIMKGGASHIEVKVKSALTKLNLNMPRNYYQPGCLWTLFDQGCGLNKSSFGYNANISAATYNVLTLLGGVPTPTGADGLATYAQGRLLFNTGVNAGLQVLVDRNDGTNLYLAYPLNAVPSPGDSITVYPGCSKSHDTCKLKFNNQANFRGFDRVPPVMLSA